VRTQVGFVTYDSGVHYYTLKPGARAPQQLVVADIDDPFMPAPEVSTRARAHMGRGLTGHRGVEAGARHDCRHIQYARTWDTHQPPSLSPPLPLTPTALRSLPAHVPQDFLVNLSEGRSLVEQLLGSLPTMFGGTRTMEAALGPALDAAFNIMQHIGGKLVVLQVSEAGEAAA
jgi:hypothetical protein